MPKDVHSHLGLPMENRLGTLDTFPFHIWRNGERMELRITPSDGVASSPVDQQNLLFRCTVSSATLQTMDGRLLNVASTSSETLHLCIHSTLLDGNHRAVRSAAGCGLICIEDDVVGELAVAIMTSLPVGGHNAYTTACITKMLCARLTHLQSGEDDTTPCGFEDWQLSALTEALDESTDQCASVAQIALRCRLSVCHFSRLFKATFGMPLHRYRVNQRIKEAKSRLIDSSDPISQIALDCGFADQSSFTRRFTAISGVSPGMWRRSGNRASATRPERAPLSRPVNA
jgi:AraC-like DNA-binding protein